MLSTLVSADTISWISICVKAMVYASVLMAAGSVLCAVALRGIPESDLRRLRRIAVISALAAAALSLARLPVRASFLMGGTWQGAFDPAMLGMVADSPLGAAIALRLVGLGLILLIVTPRRTPRLLAVAGSVLALASFAFRGHALGEPRLLLGALIMLHLLGLAFWIGAFAPLHRISRTGGGAVAAHVAHDFGRKAVWVVALLAAAGLIVLWLLTGNLIAAAQTPYGQFFAIKLAGFTAILGLAAWNKLRLTPALQSGDIAALAALRRSIRFEALLVAGILLTTAALTTVSAPLAVTG